MKSSLFWFFEGQSHFSTSWHADMSFGPQWTNIDGSLFKPPHYLQVFVANLPNMEVSVLQNNRLATESHVELKDASVILQEKWRDTTTSIKRWSLPYGRNQGTVIAHSFSLARLAEPLGAHNFRMTGWWRSDPHTNWVNYNI